jgi:hypothetical protein
MRHGNGISSERTRKGGDRLTEDVGERTDGIWRGRWRGRLAAEVEGVEKRSSSRLRRRTGRCRGGGEDWNAKEVVGWRRRSARAEIRSAGKGGGVERLSRVRARWNHSWRRSGHCLPAAIVLLVEESGWIDEGGSDGLVGLVRDLLRRRTSEGNGLSFGEGMGRVCRGVNRC